MMTAAAPRSALCTAMARPKPVEPPVTTTTKSCMSPATLSLPSAGLSKPDSRSHAGCLGCGAAGRALKAAAMDETRLTQLGRDAKLPASPDEAVLERVANPQADT